MPSAVARTLGIAAFGLAAMLSCPLAAQQSGPAADASAAQEIEALRASLNAQEKRLQEQARMLDEQRRQLEQQRHRLEAMGARLRGEPEPPASAASPREGAVAQAAASPTDEKKPERIDIGVLADVGGVLTPKGTFVFEPSIEYAHSDNNRFFFEGVELIDTVLVGLIEASEADRDSLTLASTFRYGITSRFEADLRVPYVIRSDKVTNTVVQGGAQTTQELSGNDIGDVEAGLHYQINRGLEGWPFFVANLRAKAPTGTGPYDLNYNAQGIETELATGSGFWSFEPSVTVIYPTDPAVLFGNLGYSWNVASDIGKTIGTSRIGEVDPGDNISASVGIAVALNEKTSISFGYQHDYVTETESEINGVTVNSDSLQVGAFLFGISQSISDNVGVNLNFAIGATEDAPDARVTLRVPVSF